MPQKYSNVSRKANLFIYFNFSSSCSWYITMLLLATQTPSWSAAFTNIFILSITSLGSQKQVTNFSQTTKNYTVEAEKFSRMFSCANTNTCLTYHGNDGATFYLQLVSKIIPPSMARAMFSKIRRYCNARWLIWKYFHLL